MSPFAPLSQAEVLEFERDLIDRAAHAEEDGPLNPIEEQLGRAIARIRFLEGSIATIEEAHSRREPKVSERSGMPVAFADFNRTPTPQKTKCHICHHGLDEPGAPFCSATHRRPSFSNELGGSKIPPPDVKPRHVRIEDFNTPVASEPPDFPWVVLARCVRDVATLAIPNRPSVVRALAAYFEEIKR